MAGPTWLQKHRAPATCPPAPRAARRGGPAPQRTIPCCSAARLRSPSLGCSCSAGAGLAAGPWCWGGDTGSPVSQETQAALSHTLVTLGGNRRKQALASGEQLPPKASSPVLGTRRAEKHPGCAAPKKT